jgi:hypothetical protein
MLMQRLNVLGRAVMLREHLTPSLPALSIALLSLASGGDTFTGLNTAFAELPNGLFVALVIAAALRLAFFLFADNAARRDVSGWVRGLCVLGVVFVMAASTAGGALPGSALSPVERMSLDAVILGLIAFKNAGILRAPADGGGSGAPASPPEADPPEANGLELVNLLARYAVEEHGGVFLYSPQPEPVGQMRLQPWILLLRAQKVIKNDPWVVYPDAIRAKVRANYPHLFDDNPSRFHIYRLDRDALAALMESL